MASCARAGCLRADHAARGVFVDAIALHEPQQLQLRIGPTTSTRSYSRQVPVSASKGTAISW